MSIAKVLPALGLRITAGPLELRGITDDDLVTLGELAVAGIHAPDRMPFYHPWTEADPSELPLKFAQYHWNSAPRGARSGGSSISASGATAC
ncbi:MAG TPA: hypothetical protein VFI99_07910 [Nocardioides sp.]|nr:hypothetical protein [Nocardioides sp.]